ncbi:MAG: hypothetical protein GVY13_03650 [Alphaproteobacteria bacterium]|jgi:Uma2 family endonuclease|nr:hypothetical protein [Alphaproteobacteria bacterium]
MPDAALRHMTVEEFFDWCPNDDLKWELFDGRPVAMTPPPSAHQILVGNLARRVSEALDKRPGCTVRVEAGIVPEGRNDSYYQADLAVTCRPHDIADPRNVREPILIVEVLSPSTQGTDRRQKVPDYRGIPSVQEILLVDPERLYCEVHRRLDGDRWLVELLRTAESVLVLESIGLSVPLGLIYANVALVDDGPISPSDSEG